MSPAHPGPDGRIGHHQQGRHHRRHPGQGARREDLCVEREGALPYSAISEMQPVPPQEFFDAQERIAAERVNAVREACRAAGQACEAHTIEADHAPVGSDHRASARQDARLRPDRDVLASVATTNLTRVCHRAAGWAARRRRSPPHTRSGAGGALSDGRPPTATSWHRHRGRARIAPAAPPETAGRRVSAPPEPRRDYTIAIPATSQASCAACPSTAKAALLQLRRDQVGDGDGTKLLRGNHEQVREQVSIMARQGPTTK